MAKENVIENNVTNIDFIAGDVEKVLDNLLFKDKVFPNIIVVDPPRKGLDEKSIGNILNIKPKRVVYISCNPATLVRDLSKFEDMYEICSVKPVDMFPFTSHIECITVLHLK